MYRTSGGQTDMRYYCEGSTGCEQAAARSTVVSVQQDVALGDLSVITLPHISLCGGGGPRYPSLLKGKFSSEGMGLLRYVRYHSPKQQQLSLHVAVGSPRDQLPISNLFIPVDYIQVHPPPLVPPLKRDTQNSCLYLRLSYPVLLCSIAL